ncbi:DEAD/DEAH box helicase family protein [Sulfitobacter sp. M57]|nr:DEAD/DEAH box helicase family protein [Sulfitobacter sp. KE5]MDF3424152.1 DEAD/DEAH box helicase family protein [Sulfitobacter sp. KE43]MDF3435245.1 DEAD/DEAH box helicase family protein [Sulfitobacter sp. KE42]MDF3460859.1 DEAD/DEAH box helicase family protein [Sulfitobacter sp. S74]MDF3464742.1 DEAD/DEAH box helicase family protein [Sulfitobacter sp. Ks18]MDF3468649.1 DEAD/DEAH box helicase family protein [Sulfitobacter sp. M05]MDF3472409.1 DEAD/DEAH box helicase family protein [Sulfitob
MHKPTIDEILSPKPKARPRIYAYSIADEAHKGLLKVGQTTRDVKRRVAEQLRTAAITNFWIELNEPAERKDGTIFTDHEVRAALVRKGFENTELEWMRCTLADVQTVLTELRTGLRFSGTHHETFPMRREQAEAVKQTHAYYHSRWEEDMHAVPRFLWNAKMRFGKTFTSYQLAKKMGAKRVLVVTFKPAVEDAWQSDLENHADFDGWQYLSVKTGGDPTQIDRNKPVVYFGSFQDLLGRDARGNIKAKNEWLHTENWDLVVFDEYHFGAWRETAKELFAGEEDEIAREEARLEDAKKLKDRIADLQEPLEPETEFLPITTKAYLYLSGTPFKALSTGEFIEEQIFNWTYTDEQRAKAAFAAANPDQWNPYGALPQMRLLTYQMPDELLAIASAGEFDEFDLNEFFAATGTGSKAQFKHKSDVQKWLDIIRGQYAPGAVDSLKTGTRPPFPYSDVRLLPYLQHSFWFLPNVAACHAMENLLTERQNPFWHDYKVISAAGASAGIGLEALPPVRRAIGSGFDSKSITLSCGKLTTGVTVKQWSSILMLRNLKSPETYFQAAFRVQSPWSIKNPNGNNPHEEEILKPVCFVFDFAPTRALRQLSEYGIGLSPNEANPENAVKELVSFLPVLAYNGAVMEQLDTGAILDIAMAGTSATLLARKWESALLVNVDNDTLRRILDNPEAMAAVERIEGWRALGDKVIETIINKSEKVKDLKAKAKDRDLTPQEKKELSAEEKEYKSARKLVQEKLIKFATRIPAFMYLTDFRENTLQDVITKLEPDLFRTVTGLTVQDFHLLVRLKVFNTEQMNQAVFAFRRYEDASLNYTGIDSHEGLSSYGLYNTVVARE